MGSEEVDTQESYYDGEVPFGTYPWPGNAEFLPVPGEPPRSGKFGVVWKYERRVNLGYVGIREFVALKFIAASRAVMDAVEEATALRAGRGTDTVVRLVDLFRIPSPLREDEKLFVLATEWVDGLKLDEWIRDGEPLSALNVIDVLSDVAEALSVFHNPPPVPPARPASYTNVPRAHGDIKLENVIVTLKDGRARAKVCDFGVSAVIGAHGFPAGIPRYRAPEMYDEEVTVSGQSDFFQLGIFAAELILRRRLGHILEEEGLDSRVGSRQFAMHVSSILSNTVEERSEVPSVLRSLVRKLLSPDPRLRATTLDVIGVRDEMSVDLARSASQESDPLVARLEALAEPKEGTVRTNRRIGAYLLLGTVALSAGSWLLTGALLQALD